MINKIEQLLAEIEAFAPKTAADVEAFRIKILGKKGELGMLMEEFKSVPAEQKLRLQGVDGTSKSDSWVILGYQGVAV